MAELLDFGSTFLVAIEMAGMKEEIRSLSLPFSQASTHRKYKMVIPGDVMDAGSENEQSSAHAPHVHKPNLISLSELLTSLTEFTTKSWRLMNF